MRRFVIPRPVVRPVVTARPMRVPVLHPVAQLRAAALARAIGSRPVMKPRGMK